MQAEGARQLAEAEARRQAAEEGRQRAEAEARRHREEEEQRLAQLEAIRSKAEAEARQRAEKEQRLSAGIEALRKVEAEQLKRIDKAKASLHAQEETAQEAEAEARRRAAEAKLSKAHFEPVSLATGDNRFAAPVVARSFDVTPANRAPAEAPVKAIDVVREQKGIEAVHEDPSIVSVIAERLKSGDSAERAAALPDLAQLGGDEAYGLIAKSFEDPSAEVRNAAARALYELHRDRAASFTRALREGSPERRRSIGAALAGSGIASDAINSLAGESREKTYEAFSILFLMAKAGEVQSLIQAIENHPNTSVRLAVIKLLAFSNQPEIIAAFRRLAVRGSLPAEVRSAVMEAIHEIGSQNRETPSAA